MEIKSYNYNLKQIHNICINEDKYLHLLFKFKQRNDIDIRNEDSIKVSDEEFYTVLKKFYKDNTGRIIDIKDEKSNITYYVNLSTIIKINYSQGRLFLLESAGNNIAYNVSKERADEIIKAFNE